ncbi:MAG: rhamnogalacturonan lyase [Chitinispirillaceae bacterium]|nr:rhamnogalacturonan lyase [Chitinispirillaceae bacterium]
MRLFAVTVSKWVASCAIVVAAVLMLTIAAQAAYVVEKIDRGVVAVRSGNGYLVSWRLLGHEPYNTGFNVYKGTAKLNGTPITQGTCYQDNSGGSGDYTVRAVVNEQEGEASPKGLVMSSGYHSISLSPPLSSSTANDCSTGDLDGDGQYDIVLKWEPSNAKDNSQEGVTDNVFLDGYTLDGTRLWRIDLGPNIRAGAHYTQFVVIDLDSDGKAEVMCKTAPGTKDATGAYIKLGPAASASHSTRYANGDGYILTGPEYFTIFNGQTGREMVTVDYNPPRGNVSSWGDSYGNRVDRFNAGAAYLDGERPSALYERGYYTRTTQWAIDWRNGRFTERWFFDGNNYSGYNGQGNHSISMGDVDQDGHHEIVNGAMCVDHDGRPKWTARLGHGDAQHLTDIDPNRPGLEIWGIHENASVGSALLDCATGERIWGTGAGDVGRGVAADLVASSKGLECWGGTDGLRTCTNGSAGGNPSSSNFLCWWDGDLLRELENSNTIDKYGGNRLLTASGCTSNNGTKSTPCLVADILGDWREEVIWRTTDNRSLRIYSTPINTTIRLYTLMHDVTYRCQVSAQQTSYNQPSHPGFYLGDGMTLPQERPDIVYPDGTGISPLIGSGTVQRERSASMKMHSEKVFVLPRSGSMKTAAVYDLCGKCVANLKVTGNTLCLADHGIAKGIYLVKVADRLSRNSD